MMKSFLADRDLSPNTPLYRYVTLESFISCVETKELHLTKASLWEDTWEMFIHRIPSLDENGKLHFSSTHEDIYGQCWSRVKESDAMWRIYSPSKTGVQIATSVEKFASLQYDNLCCLGNVDYFETIPDLLEKRKSSYKRRAYDFALYKRMAFSHECEVRLLTHAQHLPIRPTHISIPIDPPTFIEGVALDPRAADWYVDAIARYCKRAGLVVPVKSTLYEPDPHLKAGLVQRWVPIK